VLVVALGGPFVYFRLIQDDPPPPLSFADVITPAVTTTAPGPTPVTDTSTATIAAAVATTIKATAAPTVAPVTVAAGPVDGPWRVGSGSIAGYRIGETVGLTAQDAVGRTSKVSGSMVVNGTTVTNGSWTVDMVSVTSDDSRRDANYRRDMSVETYPTSTFVLGEPISFGSVPADGVDVSVPVKGALTLRGQTRQVSYSLKARRANGRIEALGSIPVKFADYGIPNPSNGYARTDDHGLIEFLLLFDRG